jgi:hypothetical protein
MELHQETTNINQRIARNNRWVWANSDSLAGDDGTPTLESLDPHHPIFKDVAIDVKNRVDIYDQTVGTGTVSFFSLANMGNGTRIAKPATQDRTMVAEWKAGVQFYPGAAQTAADRRMLFCAGTREGVGFGRGECNLNAEGRKLFLNAVAYMLGTLVREPCVKAWNPDPPDGTPNVVAPLLKWTAGETAILHDVYVGTNPTLGPADYRGRQQHTMYFHTPVTPGATYYWRIDEVNNLDPEGPWKGTVWSFTTANFIVVDDFEDYTDDVSSRIFQTWRDGYGFSEPAPGYPGNGTGSAVGYSQPPFAEQTPQFIAGLTG